MRNQFTLAVLLTFIFAFGAACGSSGPVALTDLKFGRDQTANPAVTEFNTGETIYAALTVSNAPDGTNKIKWRIVFDDVAGKTKGDQLGANTTEFQGSKQLWQAFGSPYPGRYLVEATLLDSSDKQLAATSGTINIVGEPVQESPDSMARPGRK